MKKRTKGILAGLLVTFLTAGIVFGAYLVWTGKDETTVKEPLEMSWIEELPEDVYPNQEYTIKNIGRI